MSNPSAMTIRRALGTWLLWTVILLIGVSVYMYPIYPGVLKSPYTSKALLWLGLVMLGSLHVSSARAWPFACIFVAGVLFGIGLAYGWAVSGPIGCALIMSAIPLLNEFKQYWHVHHGRLEPIPER